MLLPFSAAAHGWGGGNEHMTETRDAKRLVDQLLALHREGSLHVMDRGEVCLGCGGQWPCRTVRLVYDAALDSESGGPDYG